MESEEPSKISYKIREKIRSFKVTFFTKIYICMMIGIYSIYNSRRTILSNHCTTVIEKSTKKVKKKVFPQNPNISSVPEVKLMGVELIGVNKLGLINWSQLIGVN